MQLEIKFTEKDLNKFRKNLQDKLEEGHDVGRLQLQHEVEVFDGPVVVAEVLAKQPSVVVGKEVVGVKLEGGVVVVHGSAQIVEPESCQGAVYVASGVFRTQMEGFRECGVGGLPVVSSECQHTAHSPRLGVVLVEFNAVVDPRLGRGGVFLVEANLCFHQ